MVHARDQLDLPRLREGRQSRSDVLHPGPFHERYRRSELRPVTTQVPVQPVPQPSSSRLFNQFHMSRPSVSRIAAAGASPLGSAPRQRTNIPHSTTYRAPPLCDPDSLLRIRVICRRRPPHKADMDRRAVDRRLKMRPQRAILAPRATWSPQRRHAVAVPTTAAPDCAGARPPRSTDLPRPRPDRCTDPRGSASAGAPSAAPSEAPRKTVPSELTSDPDRL